MNHSEMQKWEKLSRKYDENAIPLYLSYPIESFWNQPLGADAYSDCLKKTDLSFLYFHVPFCRKICFYCMCHKVVLKSEDEMDRYIHYLSREVDLKMEQTENRGKLHTRHMHWGGGTPTLMNMKQLEWIHRNLLSKIEFIHDEANDLSIEAYPDQRVVTPEKLTLLKDMGFNAVSYGIQDFDSRIQKTINRRHDPHEVRDLIESTDRKGFRVHVDLCYGLPFQGLNELERTLEEVIKVLPSRITIFPYAHNPFLFPMQRHIPAASIPNSFVKIMLAVMADEYLTGNGYVRLGLANYIRPDDPLFSDLQQNGIKSLMGYSPHEKINFLGFGSTAISYIHDTFFQNNIKINTYYDRLDRQALPLEENSSYQHSEDDYIRGMLIQKYILTRFSIDKKQFSSKYKIDFDHYFREELVQLQQYERDGLVDLSDPDMIEITKKGLFFCRHIAHVFDTFYVK